MKQKYFSMKNVTREDGESKWTFRKLLNYGIDGLISFNNKPLRMMIYLGMFTFSISILYIIYLLINILINGINIPGYFTTIAAILLLWYTINVYWRSRRIYWSYLL